MKYIMSPFQLLLLIGCAAFFFGCGESENSTNAVVNNAEKILEQANCDSSAPITCPGEKWPEFELEDYQPNSPYVGTTYGLEKFEGKVTLVALLASY